MLNKSQITICSPQLGLSPKSALGGEVFDREILLGLAKQGVKVEIINPKGKQHDKKIPNWNITYFPITHFPALLANILYLPQMIMVYQKRSFQILRIHQPQFFLLCSIILKLLHPHLKLVATIHQFKETNFLFASKLVNNFWDHIICDSENVKSLIRKKYKISNNKITVVHNGVPNYLKPTKKDEQLLKKLDVENKFILLYMGFFNTRKNPLFILEVLRKIKDEDIVLIFWGEGPLKGKINEQAGQMKIKNQIRFISPKFGPIKNKIHNIADIFVHPSKDEGFALAPLEAMSCAKPIIMNNTHSAAEAVEDGKNGYLCKTNDLDDWSEKISQLKDKPSLLSKMSKYSYLKAKKDFSWDESTKKHIYVFKRLTS